jgi:predicted porin
MLGRQYDFIADYVAPARVQLGNIATHPFDNNNMDNDLRLNNSITFSSDLDGRDVFLPSRLILWIMPWPTGLIHILS